MIKTAANDGEKMDILTDICVFMCNCGAALFKATDTTHSKTTSFGSKILTSNTTVVGSGVCPKLGPGPCAFVQAGQWSNTSGKFTINSTKTLTNKSSLPYANGGKIKPVIIMTKVKVNKSLSMPNVSAPAIAAPTAGMAASNTGIEKLQESPASPDSPELIVKNENPPAPESTSNEADTKAKTEEAAVVDETVPDFPYALCDYKNCSEWKECEYLKAEYSGNSIDNNSGTLDKNYKKNYSAQYEEYCSLSDRCNAESTEGQWSKAAHHIISGDQIFSKHPYLVKLANFYGYDINNADNCILLPTTHDFEGKTGVAKQANGYIAMSYMKQQWHVGHHSYTIDSATVENINSYLEKTANSNIVFYKNYMEAVEHEINILESKYKKISCRKKEFDSKSKRFAENMNKVSKKVGQKLLDFKNGPKRSFPYYVSKEAIRYAFDVPQKKKFIVIYSKENKYRKSSQLTAVKMTVTRYKKDSYEVLFSADEEHVFSDARSFIFFANNVKYFICLTSDFKIPWIIDNSREYVLNDTTSLGDLNSYCQNNKQKIISFIEGRENGEMYYDPASKIIKQRLNDMIEV